MSETDKLLADVERALDDWVATYAPEFCDAKDVAEALLRIKDKGGILSYVTDLKERVKAARKI